MNNNSKYNVTLLIEDTISAQIWNQELELFKGKCNNNPEFNTVTNYTFKTEDKKLVIENNNIDSIISNFKNSENNLVFVLSDTCSTIWRNNEVYNLLEELQSNSLVSIVNLLPKEMWRGLAIQTSTEIKTNIAPNIQSNLQIEKELPWYLEKEDLEILLVFPNVNIEEVDGLIDTIKNGGEVSNGGLYKNIEEPKLENQSIKKESTPQEKENNFRFMTYQDGYSLATYFSIVDSFTLSDVEFVRKHMLPESEKLSTAQFFLGGILDKAEPLENNDMLEYEEHSIINKDTPQAYSLSISYSGPRTTPLKPEDKEQRYKIKEGISEILKTGLRYSEEHGIKVLMKEKKYQDFKIDYDREHQEPRKLKM